MEKRGYAPDFVSAETLAYRLDCSRSTIDSYVKGGLLPKPIMLGNLVRWDFAAVRAHIQAQTVLIQEDDDFLKALGNGAAKEA